MNLMFCPGLGIYFPFNRVFESVTCSNKSIKQKISERMYLECEFSAYGLLEKKM